VALFDQLGEARLRAILVDFYDRVFADVMIGFMFAGADKSRLVELEYRLTARHLGADVLYDAGRSLRTAHEKHPIRRDHDVPAEVRDAWMATAYALESVILGDGGDCG
jgi:hemoglobin